MLFIIALLASVLLSFILCGATPDNANLAICVVITVLLIGAVFILEFTVNDKKSSKLFSRIGISLPVMLAVTIFLSCYSKVDTGNTGILVTFGRVEEQTYGEGIVWRLPWQTLVQMDNKVRKGSVNTQAFSKDIQQVDLVYTVNYQINSKYASLLYRTVGIDYQEKVMQPAILESIKNQCKVYNAEELIANRDKLAQAIETELKHKLEEFNIAVVATNIENMDFSDVFTNAVEAKQVAAQEKLKAEQEAEKKKVEAEAQAYKLITEAKAEAEANNLKQRSLTPELVKYEMVQKWNGVLPQVEGASNPIIDMRNGQ